MSNNIVARIFAVWALLTAPFPVHAAPEIIGQWQGILYEKKDLRLLLKIAKAGSGYKAALYSIDESPSPLAEGALNFDGKTVKFPSGWCNYNAKVNGDILKGSFCDGNPGGFIMPMDFVRANGSRAWLIPKPKPDTSPHKAHMVTVDKNIRLEVLDWGGSGRPLIFLPGLGGTAHDFDKFAPRFTGKYHVYGINRRGMGKSDAPEPVIANYTAARLGDDVIDAIDALKLTRPVLAGFSMGGSELSSIGTRHPEKVAGLIYLDAANAYAFYSPGVADGKFGINIDANELRDRISKLNQSRGSPREAIKQIDELLELLPELETDLRTSKAYYAGLPPSEAPPTKTGPMTPMDAVFAGVAKHGSLKAPALAFYSLPERISPRAPEALKKDFARWDKWGFEQARRFADANPTAKIVYVAGADHDVFNSNPDQVERGMKSFIDGLR